MNVTPIIVGYKNTDEAVVCDTPEQAADYIVNLIEEGEDPDNIVAYLSQMITVDINLKRTASVTIGGTK